MAKVDLEAVLTKISADLDRTVSFWLKHSHDKDNGGFFNCLGVDGVVYDGVKYGWLQGRQVWMYSTLYRKVPRFQQREELKIAAIEGAKFLRSKFKDETTGKVAFSANALGEPTKIQRTIFAEVFYVMAMSGVAKITTGQDQGLEFKREALETFAKIMHWVRVDDSTLGRPKLKGNKPVESLAVPMCVLSLVHELEEGLEVTNSDLDLTEIRAWAVDKIKLHLQRNGTRVLETVGPNGEELEGVEGRKMVPGHAIECGWFLLVEAERTNNLELRDLAVANFIDNPFKYGWDKDHGGLFYFLDVDNKPNTMLEWDMKLWWAHNETMIAYLMAYKATKDPNHILKFKTVIDYCYDHFVDNHHGEWFGYLHRDGTVSMDLKGGPYKGCFHVPRALMLCEQLLFELTQ